ncbi:hypothetical protein ACOACQ_09515 [Nocardioides sp. CPCC 206347]|uniref:hypothetical protein n=1 Tax=unclassified Nocardioides TaxID=2615069 RepID=UPI003609860D
MFGQDGHKIDDLVLAWTGERPTGLQWGHGLFTLHRCVVLRGREVEVWTIQWGRPTKVLTSADIDEVEYRHRDVMGKFERLVVGEKSFWIRAADREQIEGWRRGQPIASGDG